MPTNAVANEPSSGTPIPPERPNAPSTVPGRRISARVAIRASDRGSSPPAGSSGAARDRSSSASFRCSGVSAANASSCACSIRSGGAVCTRYR